MKKEQEKFGFLTADQVFDNGANKTLNEAYEIIKDNYKINPDYLKILKSEIGEISAFSIFRLMTELGITVLFIKK